MVWRVMSCSPQPEEILEKKMIVEKVLDRLAYQDSVLVPISKTGLKSGGAEGDDESHEDPLLIVHPNFSEF